MKFRVIQERGQFRPQYKGWFGWNYFMDHGACIDGAEYSFPESFPTLESALKFLFPEKPKTVWESAQ
jgi:hypothetical protein